MLLIACSLALFVVFAGTKLLIQTKLESLGRFYKFISLFLITVGFLMVIGIGTSLATQCCRGRGHWAGMECCPEMKGKTHCKTESLTDHGYHAMGCGYESMQRDHHPEHNACKMERVHCCQMHRDTTRKKCYEMENTKEKE